MKPTIIAIVGESGSGKTTAAEYLNEKYGFKLIQSRTTRPPRYEGENGHTFVSNEEFDTYKVDDMIAFTEFGDNRYCCLHNDILEGVNVYVIDEFGLSYLKETCSDKYDIISLRVIRDLEDRIASVGLERVERDKWMFEMSYSSFDYLITCGDKKLLFYSLDKFVKSKIL